MEVKILSESEIERYCDDNDGSWIYEIKASHEALRAENKRLEQLADAFEKSTAIMAENYAARGSEIDSLRSQLAALTADKDSFLRDCLVAIAGAVCTPEKGYAKDGGFALLLRDVSELRKKHDALKAVMREIEAALTYEEADNIGDAMDRACECHEKATTIIRRFREDPTHAQP